MKPKYSEIYEHYETCFDKHGDCAKGLDWPNEEDLKTRFDVMLGLASSTKAAYDEEKINILDFGCGTAKLLDYISHEYDQGYFGYTGLDISKKFIEHCIKKHPETTFHCMDILQTPELLSGDHHIAICNGTFTMKMGLTFDDMFDYLKKTITILFDKVKYGVAFNVMSKHVDWEKDELFHLPMDMLADFLCKEVTRNFVIRNDYGLYEYTTYIKKGEND